MKSSVKTVSAIVFYCICSEVSAQNINIHFPDFAAKEYVFTLNRGKVKDTVQTGTTDPDGRVTLSIPETFKGYAGRGTWSIVGSGGIDFIINNEDFSITCEAAVPDPGNVFYTGSRENELLNRYENELAPLIKQRDTLYKTVDAAVRDRAPQNTASLPLSFFQEMLPLQREYALFREKLDGDSSYAAFFIKTLNYMKGFGSRIYNPTEQKEFLSDLTHYLADEISIARLFSSGIWMHVWSFTFKAFENKIVWGETIIKMLERTEDRTVFETFAKDMIMACEQFGWEKAELMIARYAASTTRSPDTTFNLMERAIAQSKLKIGSKAPTLNGEVPTNALLVFYESGCGHCKTQLDYIAAHYSEFTAKGIRVYSISIDENRDVYEYHSKDYPWPDKLCDFKGISGDAPTNYAIIGTPTIYLIDKDGIILDRQTRIWDITKLNIRQ
jgi:thiol-disulfide isomerase/thioredoxin